MSKSTINGPVDTSMRTIANLVAAGGLGLHFDMLRRLDLFVVFAGDLEGPASLHPANQGRYNAHSFRHEHVEASLDLLRRRDGLVDRVGDRWVATDRLGRHEREAICPYVTRIHEAARWLRAWIDARGVDAAIATMDGIMARDVARGFSMPRRRFEGLAASYGSDLHRLEGIVHTGRWLADVGGPDPVSLGLLIETALIAPGEMDRTRRELAGLEKMLEEEAAIGPDTLDLFLDASDMEDDQGAALHDEIEAMHEGRPYHGWTHVRSMLRILEDLDLPRDIERNDLRLAVMFHDAVYDPTRDDNEAASVTLFRNRMAHLPEETLDHVSSMIMATRHRTIPEDASCRLLVDLDLSILGAMPNAYARYVDGVRREYAHVTDWNAPRTKVMQSFLNRPRIFLTEHLAHLESQARQNVQDEIASLVAAG